MNLPSNVRIIERLADAGLQAIDIEVWISSILKRNPGSKAGRAIAAKKATAA